MNLVIHPTKILLSVAPKYPCLLQFPKPTITYSAIRVHAVGQTALFDDALAFGDVLADGGGDAHGDHAKVGDGVHYVVGLRERGEEMNRGRGAFCKPAKVCCEACWRYQKCEC